MKKLNLLVLMAAMMLIGTNAWATTRTAGNASEFENAWKAAQNGDVIQLTNDIAITKILWLGTETMNGTSKSITLDLNGWVLTNSDNTLKYMFFLTHGELNVITSVPGGQIIQNGNKNEELFRITGSTYKNLDPKTAESGYFTHLTIGEGVTINAQVKNAIVIDQLSAWPLTATNAWATAGTTVPTSLPYKTTVYKGSYGVANGVRIDVYGIIRGEKYAFKSNGNLGSPSCAAAADLTSFWENPAQTLAYTKKDGDVNYSPFIRIYSTADLRVPASSDASRKPVAVYCSGYARWLIEGTCIGSTAVYVKSGDVDIHNAIIQSNYTGDYVASSASNSGVTASGSAIVVESYNAYSGDIEVTVSGDTHVTATNGYAIDVAVTSATETKVDAITINGGTFEGGTVPNPEDPENTAQGTIKITGELVDNQETTIVVINGEIIGTGENNVNIGGEDLATYLSDQGETTHITTVYDGDGHVTVAIIEGAAPAEQESVISAENGTSIKWKHADPENDDAISETLTANKTLDELEINESYNQTLTIAEGVTLAVERLILGSNAHIIVEDGGKLIVTGDRGIVSTTSDNIILKSSDEKQACFLINPDITSNRHPQAQIQFTSHGYQYAPGKFYWQRFGVPSWTSVPVSCMTLPARTQIQEIVNNHPSTNKVWQALTSRDDLLVPFNSYAMTSQSTESDLVYTFDCDLVGNGNAALQLYDSFNFFANSYMAPIDIEEFIYNIVSNYPHISATVYLYDPLTFAWMEINSFTHYFLPEYSTTVNPLQAFVIQRLDEGTNPVINYADAIWTPQMSNTPAPARANNNELTGTACIRIAAADGTKDEVYLVEDDRFSEAFDNSYDATKFMVDKPSFIYANSNNGKMGILATNQLNGTTIGITTTDPTTFTMTFSHLNGECYAIRDLLTGTETEMAEGATYMFSVTANTTVDERFQVVKVNKVPTAIDHTETANTATGIYCVTGQYVGTDFHTLPAGMYIVNGKKTVK